MLIDCPGVLCKTYYRFSPHLSTYPSLNVCDFLCNCFSFPHSCGWKGSWSPSENGTECFGCEFWAHLPTISALLNCQQAAQHRLGLRFPPHTHTHMARCVASVIGFHSTGACVYLCCTVLTLHAGSIYFSASQPSWCCDPSLQFLSDPNHEIISLLLQNCNFAAVMNYNLNLTGWECWGNFGPTFISFVSPWVLGRFLCSGTLSILRYERVQYFPIHRC